MTKSVVQFIVCVVAPPPGVAFAMQCGRSELLQAFLVQSEAIWFSLTLRLGPQLRDGSFNFLGAMAQGSPADRFLYINSGTYAGHADSCWARRAKMKLAGVPRELVQTAVNDPDSAIEARVLGTSGDGGPVFATVRPTAVAWALVRRAAHAIMASGGVLGIDESCS